MPTRAFPQPAHSPRPALFDPMRLLFGTLTILPVHAPRAVDRDVAGRAMLLAPLAGLTLALLVGVPLQLAWRGGHGSSALLAALVVGVLAVLTRAMHLDGLADVADGLGSGRRGEAALAIMKKSDIGPFGVATLVVVLLLQVVALSDLIGSGRGFAGVMVGLVASRAMLPALCTSRYPAARPDGLGATMSGTVTTRRLVLSIALMGVAASFIARLLQKHRWIAYVGLAVILYVAVEMCYRGGIEVKPIVVSMLAMLADGS